MTMVESRTNESLYRILNLRALKAANRCSSQGSAVTSLQPPGTASPHSGNAWHPNGEVPAQVGQAHYGLCFHTSNGIDYNLPAQTYAVFPHREHVSKPRNTVDAIWHTWLPASDRQVTQATAAAAAFFERYGAHFDPRTGLGTIKS